MKQLDAKFLTSAADKSQWPDTGGKPEVVVVGRSNVGKSSFINALTNRKKLAYVGGTPGKTQLINFFDVDGEWTLVDVPGYGYAKLSQAQLQKMGKMMDDYFLKREGISCAISLIDLRHGPTSDDLDMVQFLKDQNIPILCIATKADKVPKTKRLAQLRKSAQALNLPLRAMAAVSSVDKTGFDEVYTLLQKRRFPEKSEPEQA